MIRQTIAMGALVSSSLLALAADKVPFAYLQPKHPITVALPDDAPDYENIFTARVAFEGDESGQVTKTKCSGDRTICKRVSEAVQNTKFNPVLKNGAATAFRSEYEFDFAYDDPKTPTQVLDESGRLVRVHVPSGTTEKMLIAEGRPRDYPSAAQLGRIQGKVLFRVIVGSDGTVHHVYQIHGHPMLVDTARKTIKGWKYQPFFVNGSAVEFETLVTINFNL